MNGIIIIGSSRSDGNTRKIVDQMAHFNNSLDIVDLNDKNIGYYDYSHANEGDDYIQLVERILNYDLIFFVTPVYWYSMSAIMKTFFDRITDLLTIRKDLGLKLRGKMMGSISCGSDNGGLVDGFALPFRESANYLGMQYAGHLHTWVENKAVPDEVVERIKEYISSIH